MRKLIRTAILATAALLAGIAIAQAATRFAAIRVDGTSDLRGAMLAKLTTLASSTSAAGVNLPAGSAPTSPVDGDLWSTTAGLFVRINGVTVGPLAAGTTPTTGSFTVNWTAACSSGTTSNTFNYTSFGGIVSLRMTSTLNNCISATTTFISDDNQVPAGIRPAGTVSFVGVGLVDNGTNVGTGSCTSMRISTSGQISLLKAASCASLGTGGWTGGGAIKAWQDTTNSGASVDTFTYPTN